MFELLWGLKTAAAFDVWSLEHTLSGVSFGHIVKKDTKKSLNNLNVKVHKNNRTRIRLELIGVLFLAYMWEAIEHYLELGLAGPAVEYWFQGTEFWVNRLITDPLMLVLGYYLSKKFPKIIIPARILTAIWLFVHIFIFPHSMWLHYLF